MIILYILLIITIIAIVIYLILKLPSNIKKIKTYRDGNFYHRLKKYNNTLFTISKHRAKGENKGKFFVYLDIFDITNLKKPKRKSSTHLGDQLSEKRPYIGEMEYVHPYLYIKDLLYIRIFDLSNLAKPLKLENYWMPPAYGYSYHCLKATNNLLFVSGYDGILILEIAQNGNLSFVNHIGCEKANNVELQDNYAFVAYQYGLKIYDVSNPKIPHIVGEIRGRSNYVGEVRLYQNYAIINYGVEEVYEDFFMVIDVQDKSNPQEISFNLPTPENITSLVIEGDFLYTGGYEYILLFCKIKEGLYVIDLKDQHAEKWHGYWHSPDKRFDGYADDVVDIAVEDKIIFAAHERSGFSVLRNTLR